MLLHALVTRLLHLATSRGVCRGSCPGLRCAIPTVQPRFESGSGWPGLPPRSSLSRGPRRLDKLSHSGGRLTTDLRHYACLKLLDMFRLAGIGAREPPQRSVPSKREFSGTRSGRAPANFATTRRDRYCAGVHLDPCPPCYAGPLLTSAPDGDHRLSLRACLMATKRRLRRPSEINTQGFLNLLATGPLRPPSSAPGDSLG